MRVILGSYHLVTTAYMSGWRLNYYFLVDTSACRNKNLAPEQSLIRSKYSNRFAEV